MGNKIPNDIWIWVLKAQENALRHNDNIIAIEKDAVRLTEEGFKYFQNRLARKVQIDSIGNNLIKKSMVAYNNTLYCIVEKGTSNES